MGNLHSNNNNWYYRIYSDRERYPNIGIPPRLVVEDYEVFQIVKK
jgi:hypothetical protein